MKVLLSIKPEFAEKIFSGEKRFEFRKVSFSQPVSIVVVYSTSPVCRIVGEFEVDDIIKSDPDTLWERTHDGAGISRDFFRNYFDGKKCGVALKIGKTQKYSIAINPYKHKIKFHPPQSFRYLK